MIRVNCDSKCLSKKCSKNGPVLLYLLKQSCSILTQQDSHFTGQIERNATPNTIKQIELLLETSNNSMTLNRPRNDCLFWCPCNRKVNVLKCPKRRLIARVQFSLEMAIRALFCNKAPSWGRSHWMSSSTIPLHLVRMTCSTSRMTWTKSLKRVRKTRIKTNMAGMTMNKQNTLSIQSTRNQSTDPIVDKLFMHRCRRNKGTFALSLTSLYQGRNTVQKEQLEFMQVTGHIWYTLETVMSFTP